MTTTTTTAGVSGLFEDGKKKPNILIIITDQERRLRHWPESFSRRHLPALERLKRHGLEFANHYTNACMCSPSRSTLLTSQFPVKTGVTRTGSPGPPRSLPTTIPNLATVMKEAGYPRVEWHGKWHVGKTPSEYGFEGWQPPDAGNYLAVNDTLGGGTPDNDGRFLKDLCHSLERYAKPYQDGNSNSNSNNSQNVDSDNNPQGPSQTANPASGSGATAEAAALQQREPFCVVASFVNPHDVYVAQHGPAKGYTRSDLHTVRVPLPSNCDEDTDANHKPRAHGQMSSRCVPFECTQQEYVNFYAYLHTLVDAKIGKLLDKVESLGFADDTLIIRTADHGEQGLSHSLVEKFFNCYQESLNIPLIVSNPIAFPKPKTTEALSSHLDLLPTLASLLGHTRHGKRCATGEPTAMQGNDLTPVWNYPELTTTTTAVAAIGPTTECRLPPGAAEPKTIQHDKAEADNPDGSTTEIPRATTTKQRTFPGIQESIHFTYDDISFPGGAPSTVRCLHKGTVKYAVYFTPDGNDADWEMYDLAADPLEDRNLAGDPRYRELQNELERDLRATMVRHETLPKTFRWPPAPTIRSVGFDHPPEARERLSRERQREANRGGLRGGRDRRRPPPKRQDTDPIESYFFEDEGQTVSITLGMKGIGAKCTDQDVAVLTIPDELPTGIDDDDDDDDSESGGSKKPRILVLIVRNFLRDDIQLSFGRPKADLTDTGCTIRENELVITMTKKDPTVGWTSFYS